MHYQTFPFFDKYCNCTACQCSPLRRKFMECSINSPALSLLMKHLVIRQRLKTHNFSALHWSRSPRGSLVSIGQHFVATRVVHLPKSTGTSLITESDQSGPDHQLLQLCTASTAWSDSDQAVRAVHSCNSWLFQASQFLEFYHIPYFFYGMSASMQESEFLCDRNCNTLRLFYLNMTFFLS